MQFALLTSLALTGALVTGPGAPAADPPDDDALTYSGSEGELQVATPRVSDPEIEVDGRLSEGHWEQAARLTGFTQYRPSEGIPASQRTEVLVFVSSEAVYLGVRAFDSQPDRIRATLTQRDNVEDGDDYVRFTLDTFNDQRRAYVIMVNPLGVQQDGVWVEGGGDRRGFGPPVDYNPDLIWESGGRVHDRGWSAELRIPFKSLRFPEDSIQAWGFQVMRNIERAGFQETWAPLSADVSNQLAQAGALEGLENLDPGLFLEMNPVLTGQRIGTVDDDTDLFETRDPEVEFGGNVTYGLTSNLTLDATFNPDFSQVEADAGQISVNERFALFFPEQRPFFLEGTEIFSMAQRLVHTRQIADPIVGAKVTGKVGGLQLGYLGAVDEIDAGDRGDAVVNLVRLKKDVGESSSLGALYTDRSYGSDDFNRVGAVDARLLLGPRYTLELLGAGSWTADPDAPDAGTETGGLLFARLERSGREFSFNASLEDVHPEFRTRSGFIRRTGDAQLSGEVEYTFWGEPGALVENVSPSLEFRGFWDHDELWDGGGFQEGELELQTRVSFRNQVTLSLSGSRNTFDFPATEYEGLFVPDGVGDLAPFRTDQDVFSGLYGVRLFGFFSMWESLGGRIRISWRENPIFDRGADVPVEVADLLSLDWNFDLKPIRALTAEVGIRHETLWRQADGTRFSTATIPRIRAQYQFSRALFLRGIVEVATQEQEPLTDPATGRTLAFCQGGECETRVAEEGHDIHVEALLSYEPSPGTVMFLGWVRDWEDSGPFRFHDTRPRSEGIFAKVSYRFRF